MFVIVEIVIWWKDYGRYCSDSNYMKYGAGIVEDSHFKKTVVVIVSRWVLLSSQQLKFRQPLYLFSMSSEL